MTELTTAIENLRAWDFYEGKLKTWIEGKVWYTAIAWIYCLNILNK